MVKLRTNIEFCPHCKANLQGEAIPEDVRDMYGATHYSRKIGFYDLKLDMTTKWICPDCNGEWNRFVTKEGLIE